MKKSFIIFLSMIMIFSFSMLTACGGSGDSGDMADSEYVGTWEVSSVSAGDEEGELEHDYTLVVNGDGTGELTSEGETAEFDWEPTDEGFKTKGGAKMTFKKDGDELVSKILGVKLHFTKVE